MLKKEHITCPKLFCNLMHDGTLQIKMCIDLSQKLLCFMPKHAQKLAKKKIKQILRKKYGHFVETLIPGHVKANFDLQGL